MSPHDERRLRKVREYCEDIQETVGQYGNSFEVFQTDHIYQYSISFCLLQIGELVNGLTDEFRNKTKSRISWQQIKGMRNIVVHDYGNIDLEIVWDVVTVDIPELIQFCDNLLADFE